MNGTGRLTLMLTVVTTAVLLASGAALAAVFNGTAADDNLAGTAEADELYGRGGNDVLRGLAGDDLVDGDEGGDELYGGNVAGEGVGVDTLRGELGNDGLMGGPGADNLSGGANDDLIVDGPADDAADDTIAGGGGNDDVNAANVPAAKDTISCGEGTDRVRADDLDAVASDCENVERITLQETSEPDPSGDAPLLEGELYHAFSCTVDGWGAEFCPPRFDIRNNYRATVRPTRIEDSVAAYFAVYRYKNNSCSNDMLSSTFKRAYVGQETWIYKNGSGNQNNVCVKINIKSLREKLVRGAYRERQGLG